MPQMRRTLLLSLLLLTGGWPSGTGQAAPTGGQSPELVITADRLEVDDKNRSATFSGHVLAIEGEMRLAADQMTVHYASPGTGDAYKVKVREVQAKGHVVLEQAEYRGTADAASYKMGSQTVELLGQGSNAVVHQGGNRLEGERILLTMTPDRRLERVVVRSGNNKRVQARLATNPAEAKPASGDTQGGARE
ncbi:MAG: LptA/OstA family protein [Magnetococcales bacterium]|nr:LptA/OstA family protein [Magnetococcales bacterium]